MWLQQLHTISPEWLVQSRWWLCFTLIWGFSGQPVMGDKLGQHKGTGFLSGSAIGILCWCRGVRLRKVQAERNVWGTRMFKMSVTLLRVKRKLFTSEWSCSPVRCSQYCQYISLILSSYTVVQYTLITVLLQNIIRKRLLGKFRGESDCELKSQTKGHTVMLLWLSIRRLEFMSPCQTVASWPVHHCHLTLAWLCLGKGQG